MNQVHFSGFAAVLAITTSAWAGVEPYPASVQVEAVSTITRAEVIADLREAQRLGMMSYGEADLSNYRVNLESSDSSFVWGDARVLRARVRAETLEASRLGLLSIGEGDAHTATAAQDRLIAAAGQHAFDQALVAQQAAFAKTAN